jgi:glucose/arabinose dehydrogenase
MIWEREAAPDYRTDSGKPGRLILKVQGATNANHGGELVFGPDGFLYIGMGDSGPGEDPQGHGQDLGQLLGKILRLDMDHPGADSPYAVPTDNPFVNQPGARPEIWATGLREPWRLSFDPVTKELWTGDVGQDRYEEVDIVRRGENYGWNVYEGFERFSNRYRKEDAAYTMPVFAYNRQYGICVTGGFVYRGDPKSPFYGVYIFGDYQSKRVFGLTQENRVLKKVRQLVTAPEGFASFATDARGTIYLVGYEGMIYTLDFTGAEFE